MPCIVSDITALRYWRTPPVARLLTTAPEDDPLLANLVTSARIRRFRDDFAGCSEILSVVGGAGACRFGEGTRAAVEAAWTLATSTDEPIDLLASSQRERHSSRFSRSRLWGGPVPEKSLRQVRPGLYVTCPELSLQQVAARVAEARTSLLATELCGTFTVYVPLEPLGDLLQELIDDGVLPVIGRWRPVLDEGGRLTDLWSRPPVATPESFSAHLEETPSRRGRRRLEGALEAVRPGAASPFEARTGVLLGLSADRGGAGCGGFTYNHRVELTPAAASVAGRATCVCDLYWAGDPAAGTRALDVECQSRLCHGTSRSLLSDSDRALALQLMDIEVVLVTSRQIETASGVEALASLIARRRGVGYREKTAEQMARRRRLLDEVSVDWGRLHES